MQLALRVIAILSFVVAIIWVIVAPGFVKSGDSHFGTVPRGSSPPDK